MYKLFICLQTETVAVTQVEATLSNGGSHMHDAGRAKELVWRAKLFQRAVTSHTEEHIRFQFPVTQLYIFSTSTTY